MANNQLSNVTLPVINQFDPSAFASSSLDISGNNYTSISIVPGTNITSFICNNTQLISLDLSNIVINNNAPWNEQFFQINNNSNLTYINLKNGFYEGCYENSNPDIFELPMFCNQNLFGILNNPSLNVVCVDNDVNDRELNYFTNYLNYYTNQPNIHVTTYCSFTPGGTFYTIQGTTRLDNDANGCDANDFVFPNQRFTLTNGTI